MSILLSTFFSPLFSSSPSLPLYLQDIVAAKNKWELILFGFVEYKQGRVEFESESLFVSFVECVHF